jgi:hypothetical protein
MVAAKKHIPIVKKRTSLDLFSSQLVEQTAQSSAVSESA